MNTKKIFYIVFAAFLMFSIQSCGVKKVANDNIQQKTSVSKGSSFETAIKVNSVSAEYEYIRKVCPSCKFSGQALVFNNKKPYDILTVVDSTGTEMEYYFDISSFFGKGF